MGLTPAQVGALGASEMNILQNLISSTLQKQQIGVTQRGQTLAEQQFTSQEIDTKRERAAVDRLAGVTYENVDQISPRDATLIDRGNLGRLINIAASARQGVAPTTDAPREVRLLAAMRQQVGKDGDITQSDIWKIMMTGKNREKNEKDMRERLVIGASRNPVYATQSPEEQKEFIDRQVEAILGGQEPAARTKGTLLEKTLSDFNQSKRNEAVDALMGGRLSQ